MQTRSSKELKDECQERGIVLDPAKKYSRQDMVTLLGKYSYDKLTNPSWGLTQRMKYDSLMLCFSFKHNKPAEQKEMMSSDKWIAEKKYNGSRQLICYHPEEGFTFFSRSVSVDDFLPVDYTEKVLLQDKDGNWTKPADWKGKFRYPFILDSEVVTENSVINTGLYKHKGGVVTGSELNAVVAILALNPEESHKVQMEQAPLKFYAFDITYVKEMDLTGFPLRNRKEFLSKVMSGVSQLLPFEESEFVTGLAKEELYIHEINTPGAEGVVLKNLDSLYVATESRGRNKWVKRKRSMRASYGEDFDAYITGWVPSDPSKGYKDLIGAIKLSVYLKEEDGSHSEHFIASISGLPLELRKEMSIMENGQPALHPDFYGRVLVINGQSISSRNLRFMHSHVDDWDHCWRPDKNAMDCVVERAFIESQVM